ncbi:MAG: hypothetical protein ACJAZN_001926 [Planctomycetota bacterium]|jgi:hypothetical protein
MSAKYKTQITYLDANTTNQPGATNTTNADADPAVSDRPCLAREPPDQ